MTTFYLDPVNGSDAADGLSFANRWKTLTNGATAARIAPGDEIRFIESDINNLGAAQWTDDSGVITPVTSRNKLVDAGDGTGWVASTNVTVTSSTTAANRKTEATALRIAVASAFTTGKMAYKDLGSDMDLSAYQQLSFWFTPSTAVVAQLYLDLCSDATGDVPVATLTFPLGVYTARTFRVLVLDNGAALPSNVRSIALRAGTDPSTANFVFQNIVACKAPGPDAVTHRSVIGKNTVGEPWWYGINKITDTSYELNGNRNSYTTVDPPMPYKGVTESVDTYCMEGFLWGSSDRTLNENGADGNPITITGGWNSTDMSSQDGETWLQGEHYNKGMFTATGIINYIHVRNIGLLNLYQALNEVNHGWDVELLGVIGAENAITGDPPPTYPARSKIYIRQVWGTPLLCNGPNHALDIVIDKFHGSGETSINLPIFGYTGGVGTASGRPSTLKVADISNNAGTLFTPDTHPLIVYDTVTSDNAADIYLVGTSDLATLTFINCTLGSASKFTGVATSTAYKVTETNVSQDPKKHITTVTNGSWETVTTPVHTPGGVSWALKPANARFDSMYPLRFPLANIAVEANKLVTFKCWLRRDSTDIEGGLVSDGTWPGVTETRVPITVGADTWEELTLTFTPTVAGVVSVDGYAYGGTTNTVYFGDVTITQAA